MQTHTRWTIDYLAARRPRLAGHAPTALVVPQFPVPRGMPAEAAALLPNIDYNSALLSALDPRPRWSRLDDVATFFAADPFLRVDQFARSLGARGFRRVANLPTCALFGTEFRGVLHDVDLDYGYELGRLAAMAAQGFEIYPLVTSSKQATAALGSNPAGLIAVRCPPLTREQIGEDTALKSLCAELRSLLPTRRAPLLLALTGERGSRAIDHVDGTIRYAL